MKTVRVKVPRGPTIRINAYETSSSIVDEKSAKEFNIKLKAEKEYDRQLEEMAREIAAKIAAAESQDRALAYWEAGRVMKDHILSLDEIAKSRRLENYMGHERTRARVMEKVKELSDHEISPHYFRKFERFADLMTREQVERPVPYSLQHELIYSWLSRNQRDRLLDRCEGGEITTNVQLREEVKKLKPKDFESADSPDEIDDSWTPGDGDTTLRTGP